MSLNIIIGGASGVGHALATRLRSQDRPVLITSRDADKARAVAGDIGADWLKCDVGVSADIAELGQAAATHGAVSGFAYAAGSIVLKPFEKTTAADFEDAYKLNVVGAADCLRALAKPLKSGGGSAVLFSTVAAAAGFPNHAAIASAKAGVEGLTRSLAAEWAGAVRVNAIAPSLTRTPLAKFITGNEAMAKAVAGLHPIPRLGEADDAAALAEFLIGESASWITGQVFAVDGGRAVLRHKN